MDNQKQFMALIILLAVTYTLFFIILPENDNNYQQTTEKAKNINEESGFNESNRIALERIRNSYQYIDYNGSNIHLTQAEHTVDCDACWTLTYIFEVNPDNAPANVKSIEMKYEIIENEINHMTMTEISENSQK